MGGLPTYARNKQESEYDTSSHCNLFNTEWGANRGTDRELNSGRRPLPCNHEFLFRRDFRYLFLVKIHVGNHSLRGQTP
jgi:hypothetical protein